MGTKDKKRLFAVTLKWLETNYCVCEGVCLPRNIVYDQYLEFCSKENLKPSCKATFGKVIKTKFPAVTSKRLGARGHSKYHYYGMAIKETSSYYQELNPIYGLTRYSNCRSKPEGGFSKKYSLSCKAGTLLPTFPEVNEFNLNGGLEPDKTLLDILIPNNMQEMPERLLNEVRCLGEHWENLVETSLENLPHNLKTKKIEIARIFGRTLKRNVVFLHLVQTIRPILCDSALVKSLIDDLDKIDVKVEPLDLLENIYSQKQPTRNNSTFVELKTQIRQDATVEGFIEWLDLLFCSQVLEPNKLYNDSFKCRSSEFLLQWSFLGSRLMRNLTLINAENFVPFHLIRLMMDEYIFLIIESHTEKQKEEQLENNLKLHMKNPTNSKHFFRNPGSCFKAGNREPKRKVKWDTDISTMEPNINNLCNRNNNFLTPPHTPSEKLECRYSVNGRLSGSKPLSHFPNEDSSTLYHRNRNILVPNYQFMENERSFYQPEYF